jgi:hypothetical protein
MPLAQRIIKVTISLPSGNVVLTQALRMNVSVFKAALAIQSRATIDVIGMTTSLRQRLLTQFTAWHKRKVESGGASQDWIDIQIEAGWDNSVGTSVIFKGQVVLVEPSSGPPNIGVRITCFTRQIDKTTWKSNPAPFKTTFENYVRWASKVMGLTNEPICQTSYNDLEIKNPARSIYDAGALLIDIQNQYRYGFDVVAFVDNDQLIVIDKAQAVASRGIVNLSEFIQTPTWTEWGASFLVLMEPRIQLVQAVTLNSLMNPGVNGTYVLTTLEYTLSSRDVPFYVRGNGSPPA